MQYSEVKVEIITACMIINFKSPPPFLVFLQPIFMCFRYDIDVSSFAKSLQYIFPHNFCFIEGMPTKF